VSLDAKIGTSDQENGMLGQLPMEILRLILNGGPSVDLRTMRPPHPWEKRLGAHLDMRWRFAARAVCHLWRAIIEHPTPSEARTIGWHKAARYTSIGSEAKCLKWVTGRVVCSSVIADWVKWTARAWSPRTADRIYEWCRYMVSNVPRKQIIVALTASTVVGAIQHATLVEWERVQFTPDDLFAVLHGYGGQSWWDDDVRGSIGDIWNVLASVIAKRAYMLTPIHMFTQRCRVSTNLLLREACRAGNGTLVRLLLGDNPQLSIRDDHWEDAAQAPYPDAFDCLLHLRNQGGSQIGPRPTAFPMSWFGGAVAKGRWRTLAVCDRHGIAFDDSAALVRAASYRRVRLMAWLWDRAQRRNRRHTIDLFEVAVQAMEVAHRHVRHSHRAIEWLCDVAHYEPHTSESGRTIGALMGTIRCACARSVMRALSRWPRSMCSGLDMHALERVFIVCARESLERTHAFLALLDRHGGGDRALMPGPDGFDGWALLTKPHPAIWANPLSVHETLDLDRVLAFMRTARRGANGYRPLRKDVKQLSEDRGRARDKACLCTGCTEWPYGRVTCGSPAVPSIYGTATTDGVPLQRVSARRARRRVRKRIEARACPPTEAANQLAYLMGRWCAPRPVTLEALFPGWDCTVHGGAVEEWVLEEQPLPAVNHRLAVAEWLECVGLLRSETFSAP